MHGTACPPLLEYACPRCLKTWGGGGGGGGRGLPVVYHVLLTTVCSSGVSSEGIFDRDSIVGRSSWLGLEVGY